MRLPPIQKPRERIFLRPQRLLRNICLRSGASGIASLRRSALPVLPTRFPGRRRRFWSVPPWLRLGNDVLRTGRRYSRAATVGVDLPAAPWTSTIRASSRPTAPGTRLSSVSVRGGSSCPAIDTSNHRIEASNPSDVRSDSAIVASTSCTGFHEKLDQVRGRRKTKPNISVEKFVAHYKHPSLLPSEAGRHRSGSAAHHAAGAVADHRTAFWESE
jgi:hypothetical protein